MKKINKSYGIRQNDFVTQEKEITKIIDYILVKKIRVSNCLLKTQNYANLKIKSIWFDQFSMLEYKKKEINVF